MSSWWPASNPVRFALIMLLIVALLTILLVWLAGHSGDEPFGYLIY